MRSKAAVKKSSSKAAVKKSSSKAAVKKSSSKAAVKKNTCSPLALALSDIMMDKLAQFTRFNGT
jgi:hypothetical protein